MEIDMEVSPRLQGPMALGFHGEACGLSEEGGSSWVDY